jgi:hypothetical protein
VAEAVDAYSFVVTTLGSALAIVFAGVLLRRTGHHGSDVLRGS